MGGGGAGKDSAPNGQTSGTLTPRLTSLSRVFIHHHLITILIIFILGEYLIVYKVFYMLNLT